MNLITPENYIKQNAPTVAENCIKFLLWNNASFRETLTSTEDHIREFGYCDPARFTKTVLDILGKASESEQALKKFVESRRKLQVRPYRRTSSEYIRMEWETQFTLSQIVTLIRGQMHIL